MSDPPLVVLRPYAPPAVVASGQDVDALFDRMLERAVKVGQLRLRLDQRLVVQTVAPGEFDCTDLEWVRLLRTCEGETKLLYQALISVERTDDFLKGEAARGTGDAFLATNKKSSGTYCLYGCPCGGRARERTVSPALAVLAAVGERKRGQRGPAKVGSKKFGCDVRFSISTSGRGAPLGCALITCFGFEHSPECSVQAPRIVSEICVKRVESYLAAGHSVSSVLKLNADHVVAEVARAKGLPVAQVTQQFLMVLCDTVLLLYVSLLSRSRASPASRSRTPRLPTSFSPRARCGISR
jgi:hypothetical protein